MSFLPDYTHANRELEHAGIVVHYFSAINVDPDNAFDPGTCRKLILDLNRPTKAREWFTMSEYPNRLYASYHYVIARNGGEFAWVPRDRVAYHAGESSMNGREGCNEFTLGVTFLSDGSDFTDAQYAAGADLLAYLSELYHITPDWIQGHEDVAPNRKKDPGPNFDWDRVLSSIRD